VTSTRGRRRRDKADNVGKLYVHAVYMQLSSYRTTDPKTYHEVYVVMEPSREDRASCNVSLWELSSHYDPVESVGVRPTPPHELAAVAEEVESENG